MTMNNEETYLQQHIRQENPFRVPDGYFEQFASQVMSSLPETAECTTVQMQSRSRMHSLRPLLYAAASVVVAVVLGTTFFLHRGTAAQQPVQAAAESTYIDDAADYAMLDNAEIYACLTEN